MACEGNCASDPTDETFWQEIRSLLLQMVCLIEKQKLAQEHTTADLRREGKRVLRDKNCSQ